jgi:hypothetical protein
MCNVLAFVLVLSGLLLTTVAIQEQEAPVLLSAMRLQAKLTTVEWQNEESFIENVRKHRWKARVVEHQADVASFTRMVESFSPPVNLSY